MYKHSPTMISSSKNILKRFVGGYAGDLLEVESNSTPFLLSFVDRNLEISLIRNRGAGWITLPFEASALCSKTKQYQTLRNISPDLCFDGWSVLRYSDLPSRSKQPLVIRPDMSCGSKGSAVILDNDVAKNVEGLKCISCYRGPFQVHVYEPGQSFFVNGVMIRGMLHISDTWRCFVKKPGCWMILTNVINHSITEFPKGVHHKLEYVANGFGIHNGPVHFEVVKTMNDDLKLVKFSPRLASEPLPSLCDIGCFPSQPDLFINAFLSNAQQPIITNTDIEMYVADHSFILSKGGYIVGLNHMDIIRKLPCFFSIYHEPQLGQWHGPTKNGYSYGLTVFLRHNIRENIFRDICTLKKMDSSSIFSTKT